MIRWEASPLRGSPARRLFSWPGWNQLEVSNTSTEETGGEILVFRIEDLSLEETFREEVFLLKDLDNNVTHNFTLNDNRCLPPTMKSSWL